MKLRLTLSVDSAGRCGVSEYEVARVFARLSARFRDHNVPADIETGGTLFDLNGNGIGSWELTRPEGGE